MSSPSTTIILVRHGQTEWNVSRKVMGKLAIPLNTLGRIQAQAAKTALETLAIDHILHSPYLRTQETAATIHQAHCHLALDAHTALCEVDYGHWEGKDFAELYQEAAFTQYFSNPDLCTIPGGECMRDVQTRVVGLIESLRESHAGKTVVLVSHSDIIKAALVHFLGIPLSGIHRLAIDNGSLSLIQLSSQHDVIRGDRVLAINRTHDLPAAVAHLKK